jgi:hypothetical protein
MVIEIVIITRRLLEKCTIMFNDEFEKDRADPTRHCSIIDLL